GNSLLVLQHVKAGPNAKGPVIPLGSKGAAPKSAKLVVPPGGVKGGAMVLGDLSPVHVGNVLAWLELSAQTADDQAKKALAAAFATSQALGGADGNGPVDLAKAQASVQTAQGAVARAEAETKSTNGWVLMVKDYGGTPDQVNQANSSAQATQTAARAARQAA